MTTDPVLLAWAAGFFEGEGCIGHATGTPRSIGIGVVNTDLERLEKFAAVMDCGLIRDRGKQGPNRKRVWQWSCYGDNAIRVFRASSRGLGLADALASLRS